MDHLFKFRYDIDIRIIFIYVCQGVEIKIKV